MELYFGIILWNEVSEVSEVSEVFDTGEYIVFERLGNRFRYSIFYYKESKSTYIGNNDVINPKVYYYKKSSRTNLYFSADWIQI